MTDHDVAMYDRTLIKALTADNDKLRAEVERLTGERDEWKAKWVALGQASMILGTISRQAAEIERLKAHQNATMCMLHADCADGCKHAEIERLKAENERLRASINRDIKHASCCAVHSAPALPVGPCDCGALEDPQP